MSEHPALALPAVVLLVAVGGCGEDGPPPGLLADITRLQALVEADPALGPLDAVDEIADDRPVHAARLLRTSALPAAVRQAEAAEALEATTPRGRTYSRRAARAYRARVSALDTYRDVLEQGISADPMDVLDAIQARREAEVQLLELMRDLEEVVPGASRPRPPADEGEGEGEGALTGPEPEPTPPP